MSEKPGSFLVFFRPGEVTGKHSVREIVLKDICDRFGGFDCKVFDPYLLYSELADSGSLVRVEEKTSAGPWTVAFYYPSGKSEREIRKTIINAMLTEAKNDPKLLTNGYVVVSDKRGDLSYKIFRKKGRAANKAESEKFKSWRKI